MALSLIEGSNIESKKFKTPESFEFEILDLFGI
jgi:hypothetical protein